MEKKEVFLDVKGFEGVLKVSNFGRLEVLPQKVVYKNRKSDYFYPGYMKSKTLHPDGFLFYSIRINYKQKMFTINKLVASHFCENPEGFKRVKHLDGNKLNCEASNLIWVKNYKKNTLE